MQVVNIFDIPVNTIQIRIKVKDNEEINVVKKTIPLACFFSLLILGLMSQRRK